MALTTSMKRASPCTSNVATARKVTLARPTAVHTSRREITTQLLTLGIALLGTAGASYAADAGADSKAAGESRGSSSGFSISISPVNTAAKAYMDMRDEAMENKCKGGMFDCDGDRREFAHKQWTDWLESGGVPKRIRDGKPTGPRSY